MRFGCQTKYNEAENVEGICRYHRLPPVFHETAKFWACCPDQKCYDWEDFMKVKGCMSGMHSREKPNQQFLGGNDVRVSSLRWQLDNDDVLGHMSPSRSIFPVHLASGG